MQKTFFSAVAAIVILTLGLSCYTVDNTESIIVLRFGKAMRVITDPGIHLKMPFLEKTVSISKRQMYYTSQPSQVITKDKKSILIDNYCQWKVSDPLKVYLTMRDESGAARRLDDIIYSGLRVELARHDLIEIINENRRIIMTNVTTIAREKAADYGIDIIDIRIKRTDLPKENEKNIYARMVTERQRIAKQYRSEGEEEAQKIRAKTDRDVAVLLAEANRDSLILRGKADAAVNELYAHAFSRDPRFYEFNRLMSFYKEGSKDMKIVITTESDLFKLIKKQ